MDYIFIQDISNVQNFIEKMSVLKTSNSRTNNFVLVWGPAGLGKTDTITWHSAKKNNPMLRAKSAWTVSWMLDDLATALGLGKTRKIRDKFEQITDELMREERIIFIDELDHVASNHHLIQTLRDITDITCSKVVLIGMEEAKRKLQRFPDVISRVAVEIHFTPLLEDDVSTVVTKIIPGDHQIEVFRKIHNASKSNFRLLIDLISKLQTLIKHEKLSGLKIEHVDKVIKWKG